MLEHSAVCCLGVAQPSAGSVALKIILSRKGFDSAAGGVPSPIFPDGSFRSLPIPMAHGMQLKEIGHRGHALGTVVNDLTRGKYSGATPVHLDPDLMAESLQRKPGWRPLFGQTGAAQGHLAAQGVTRGDVFLFFGWFRQVAYTGGVYRYRTDAPDLHVIFGWLQIEKPMRVSSKDEVPNWALYHPHFNRPSRHNNDTVYMASDRLRLPHLETQLPGAGAFDRFDRTLCLTHAGATRSVWRLPLWFYPAGRKPLTYHKEPARWRLKDDALFLQAAHQGQEFVLDCDEYPQALTWLAGLLEPAAHNDRA